MPLSVGPMALYVEAGLAGAVIGAATPAHAAGLGEDLRKSGANDGLVVE